MFDIDGEAPVGEETVVDGDYPEDLDEFSEMLFSTDKPEKAPKEEVEAEEQDQEDDVEDDGDSEEDADGDADDSDEEDNDVEDSDDEDDEPEEEEEDEEEEQPQRRNRKTAKERIRELVSERNADRAVITALQERLARLEENSQAAPKETPEAPTTQAGKAEGAPDPDAVDAKGELIYPLGQFDPKYNEDLTAFNIRQQLKTAKEEALREEAELAKAHEEEVLLEEWNQKFTASTQTYPDFKEKVADLEDTFSDVDPVYGAWLAKTIMSLERGPEVLYYLANNHDVADAIVGLDAVKATVALGEIQGLLKKPTPEKPKKKSSKAPKPPVAVRGTGATSRVRGDTDDLEAFEREFFGGKK